jgi:antitoxin HicB
MQYPCVVRPLNEEDGGGYLAFFLDLPGCMSDGDSPQEAIENALDALQVYLEAQEQRGAAIPAPDSASVAGEAYINDLLAQIDALTDTPALSSSIAKLLLRSPLHAWTAYPRWVAGSRMTQADADREIATMAMRGAQGPQANREGGST